MLPTLTRPMEACGFKTPHAGRRVAATCANDPEPFVDRLRWQEAAAVCDRCPLMGACLDEAMRLQRALLEDEDLWGVYGCWGGVWFEPGRPPEHIPRRTRGAA